MGGYRIFLRTEEYANGKLGGVRMDISKAGSMLQGLVSLWMDAVSLGLQYGVPLDAFVKAFLHTRFDPQGQVDGDGPILEATSLGDLLARILGVQYGVQLPLVRVKREADATQGPHEDHLGPPCKKCGGPTGLDEKCVECIS